MLLSSCTTSELCASTVGLSVHSKIIQRQAMASRNEPLQDTATCHCLFKGLLMIPYGNTQKNVKLALNKPHIKTKPWRLQANAVYAACIKITYDSGLKRCQSGITSQEFLQVFILINNNFH